MEAKERTWVCAPDSEIVAQHQNYNWEILTFSGFLKKKQRHVLLKLQ